MADVYRNALTSEMPIAEPPAGALAETIHLHAHQKVVLKAMEVQEQRLTNGYPIEDELFFSNFAVLGDAVGAGKSLMVLSHIARLPHIERLTSQTKIGQHSNSACFSIRKQTFSDLSEAGCLLIVPHTLYRQWANYIKLQTTLNVLFIDKKKAIQADGFQQQLLAADLVLVSNTFYREFSTWQKANQIRWKRLFIDEADTIHLVSGYPFPQARFTWFITASWMNMLFFSDSFYLAYHTLQDLVFQQNARYSMLKDQFKDLLNSHRTYFYQRYTITSANFFKDHLYTNHRFRSHLVLRCSDQFIKESISLPSLIRRNIVCRPSIAARILEGAITNEVRQLLHAGDTEGAIEQLGVKAEDVSSLVDAVTKSLQHDLQQTKALYEYKSTRDYATQKAKEDALAALEDKIRRMESQIQNIRLRIENFKKEACPICYDDPPSQPLLTPCCSQVFCGNCILQSYSRTPSCPMCRAGFALNTLRRVVGDEEKNQIVASGASGPQEEKPPEALKKTEALLKIFEENPNGRFLVFSRYDNPFATLESQIEILGIKVRQLKGNKDAVAATLRSFQAGEIRCLLLNSRYAGSGLNITAASHVILLHAMSLEEDKQILGRAYRLGREDPLYYIRLLHPDEVSTAE